MEGGQKFEATNEEQLKRAREGISELKDISLAGGALSDLKRVNVEEMDYDDAEMWGKIKSIESEGNFEEVIKMFNAYRKKIYLDKDSSESKKHLSAMMANYLQARLPK